jgi:tetratricopeptide (TPR) repeat protein
MSTEIADVAVIEEMWNSLSSDARESLHILSIPTLLFDPLAETLLIELDKGNGNSQELVKEIRSFPIWHYRTKKSWVIDDDVRECALEKLNGSKKELMEKVLYILKNRRSYFENVPLLDMDDYDIQILRLSSKLEEHVTEGICGFRKFFNFADKYNRLEIGRVVDLYLEESFGEYLPSDKLRPDEACNVYFMRGYYAYKKRNFSKAIKFFLLVCKSSPESIESTNDVARALHLLGVIWSNNQKRWKEAENAFNKSINLLEQIGFFYYQAQVYHSLGHLLSRSPRRRGNDAEEAYKQSITLFINENDQFGQALVQHSYGNLLSSNWRRYDDAENHYDKSLELLRQMSDSPTKYESMGKVYHSFGRLLQKIKTPDRWNDARESYRLSIRSLENAGDLLGRANVHKSLGELLSKRRAGWDDAKKEFKQSLDLLRKIDNPYIQTKSQARIYHNLGKLLSNKRSGWDDAEESFEQSVKLFGKVKDQKHQAEVYYDHGKMLSREKTRWDDAEHAYEQSLKMFEYKNYLKEVVRLNTDYGSLLYKKGDFKRSKLFIENALKYEKNKKNREVLLQKLEKIETIEKL